MNAQGHQERDREASSSDSPERGDAECLSARKRAKRRRNKERQRLRAKEAKEQATALFEGIIREIYGLRANYESVKPLLEEWFARGDSSEIMHEALDTILRREVELIRRQIGAELLLFSREEAQGREQSVRRVFESVQRIQRGSAEVEKVFNLFMRRRYGEEEPVRINLDLLTLKFLYRKNLQPSPHFAAIVRLLDQQSFQKERQIYQAMLKAANSEEEDQGRDSESSEEEEQLEEQEEEVMEEQQEEEGGVEVGGWESPRRRRRKKRGKMDLEASFEAILQRTAQLQIREEDRTECKVEEGWIERIRQQSLRYRRPR